MMAAIIAAGRGERFRAGGVNIPKPLIRIDGVPLIDRILRAVAAAGIEDAVCLLNQEDDAVATHCREQAVDLDLRIVRRSTPSSMESLFTLAPFLRRGRFLLLTVDAIFGPTVLPRFLRDAAAHPDVDGVLAVHGFVDDEKPLWVATDESGRIVRLGPDAIASGLITAGFYIFDPRIFAEIAPARVARLGSLREFLGHLRNRQYALVGVPVPKTIDVDRPADIGIAEAFARSGFVE